VDDEPVDIAVMQRSLERAGYDILVASNYDEALAQLTAHGSEIKMLITDISLPGRTGLDIARACLQQQPELKVLFVSGWTGAEFLDYVGIRKEDLHFLPRPFRSSQLISRVRKVADSTEQISWLDTDSDKAALGA